MRFGRMALAALAAVAVWAGTTAAAAAFWYPLVDDPRVGQLDTLPPCADVALAQEVVGRFNSVERTYWNGLNVMVGVQNLREEGFHPRRDDKVARRWCGGTALFADGNARRIVLELGAGTGFVGLGYGLAYCVQGLDRHLTYAPNCRVLRHREF